MIPDSIMRELEASRRAIRRDVTALRYQLDVQERAKDAIRNHPVHWLGGFAATGFVLAFFSRRPRRSKRLKPAGKLVSAEAAPSANSLTLLGVLVGIFKVLAPLLRPALSAFAARRFAEMVSKL